MTAAFITSELTAAGTTAADRDLQERVALFIQQRQLARGAELTVFARRGVVTLIGVVNTFHQRQLLQSLVRRVAGVVQLQDELEVITPASSEYRSPRRELEVSALAQ